MRLLAYERWAYTGLLATKAALHLYGRGDRFGDSRVFLTMGVASCAWRG